MIEFRSVSKAYKTGTQVLSNIDLVIPPRAITVFVGPSGSGKSTLLRMINRMVDPASGHVLIDGEDVAGKNPVQLRRGIGYVMQNSGLMPHYSVAENIGVVLKLQKAPKPFIAQRTAELLEVVGLDASYADRFPHQLSGGQQQRVNVARGLASDPNILLMDEPFGAVDPLVRKDLQNELLRIQSVLAKTIVFVTHDIDEALLLGDQIVVLSSAGTIAQVGTPAEIIARPATDFVADFVGVSDGRRSLRVAREGDRDVLVNGQGRVIGVLDESIERDQ